LSTTTVEQHARRPAASELESRIGHVFHDSSLLEQALTHASSGLPHLERLEFLGDAVLGMIVADELYRRFPEEDEGMLTRMRAVLVCRAGLLQVATDWGLDRLLEVGPGERNKAGVVRSASICANAVEAVIGAVFLDAGWPVAQGLVLQAWQMQFNHVAEADGRDAKTRLQEYMQARGWGLPEYVTSDHGVAHHPRFSAQCMVRGESMGSGAGERKKTAELRAAQQACQKLNP